MNTHQRGGQRKKLAKEAATEVGEEGNQKIIKRLREWDQQGKADDSEGKYGAGVRRDRFGGGWL